MRSKSLVNRIILLGLFLLVTPAVLGAQVAGKKALTHDDYDIWKRVSANALADNGDWIAFVVSPREGDGVMTLRSLGDETARLVEIDRGSGPRITPDSRFLIFTIDPMQAVVDSLEEADVDRDEMPQDSLGVVDLSSAFRGGSFDDGYFRSERVQNWKTPADEGAYLAYLLEPEPEEEPDSTAAGEEAEEAAPARRPGGGRPGAARRGGQEDEGEDRRKEEGDVLVFRDLRSGEETRFEDVTDYYFTNDGSWLVYAASNEDGSADGVYAVRTSSAEATPILTGEGEYAALALADSSDQVAFLTNRDDWEAEGWWVPDDAQPRFSDNGSRILFGTAPRPPAEDEEEEIPEDERVEVDIWNWKDPLIQPMQLVNAERVRNQTYQAYASTDDHQVVQLGRLDIPRVSIAQGDEGELAVATTDQMVKYGWDVSHDGSYVDVYLMDVATGEAELVIEKIKNAGANLSPTGRYLTWWDGIAKHYMSMDVNTREVRNLTEGLPFPVHNEIDDHPDIPRAYGSPGWLEGDQAVLIYDRFDIWQVDPSGMQEPRNLTEGVGRANDIRFRYVNLDGGGGGRYGGGGSSEGIDPTEDALLEAFNIYTKQDGFYRDRFDGNREPRMLIMDDVDFSRPTKAEDADVYIITKSTFEEYSDLWLTDRDFEEMERISYANPQQDEYRWGSAELVEWISNDGIPLQGILYKPEGFDPRNTYPMMVYFYERNSDNLHRYYAPNAGSSSINYSFYVSRGYVLFVPDIPYEIGHPGESAIDAVVPGVLKILDEGYVDPARVGAQGHSWGGYQLAYMVTRTNLFAAVEAGAPVSNMTSAYGGIRWDSGMNRQFQYEHTQSRIGGSLWEETLRYINNSPIFEADKVQTPIMFMHNDADGAVPWYQGIELYMALRRLQKPVWMLNYNGEPHGLRQRPNQEDFAIRMQQFFDHYLKDAPAPVWMVEGVPAVMKGKKLGLELVDGTGGGDGKSGG
ncbi:MAG: prolyl oligopeptidase family serine peptidase [Gemmatimonadota bacterium]